MEFLSKYYEIACTLLFVIGFATLLFNKNLIKKISPHMIMHSKIKVKKLKLSSSRELLRQSGNATPIQESTMTIIM